MGGCAETERWVAEAERCVSVRWMAEAERWVVDTVRWEAEAERWVAVPRQRKMGGCAEAERWMAVPRQRDGWLRQRDVCHSKMDGRGREMGG